MKYVIVGIGGVGTRLAHELPMYLSRTQPGAEIVLIDGDVFEEKNAERQHFDVESGVGVNKAAQKVEELRQKYPGLSFSYHAEYVTSTNAEEFVPEGSVVFCAVDNHASRKLLSERVSSMKNGMLISGGSDYHDGNVQAHVRRDGVDMSAPITHLHPEIAVPADKNPAEMSCEELAAASAPQLQFANLKVATEMLATFWTVNTNGDLHYSEVYFDLKKGTQRPVMRRKREHVEATDRDAGLADREGAVRPAG